MKTQGIIAELRAAVYLKKHGYKIIHLHWRGGGGEIDIVAKESGMFVLVEVKSSSRLGAGQSRVDKRKMDHLHMAAAAFEREYQCKEYRFDIVEISDAGVHLIRGAF